MIRAAFVAFSVALLGASGASAQTAAPVLGPFHPPMSVADAMAAAPDLAWRTYPGPGNQGVAGASTRGVSFNGEVWEVTVGDTFSVPENLRDLYSLDLKRVFETRNARECSAAMSEIVRALEPMYGPFGQHPAFRSGGNTLYGAPWGDFRMADVGTASRMRDYGSGEGLHIFTTFNEVDEANGRAVMVGATFYDEMNDCELRVHDFTDRGRAERAQRSRTQTR